MVTVVRDQMEITFVIADKLAFEAAEPMHLEVTIKNLSDSTIYLFAEQSRHFAMLRAEDLAVVWTDDKCRPDDGPDYIPAAVPIEPGEVTHLRNWYPSGSSLPPRASSSGAECLLEAGEYAAVGFVEWCPPETLETTSNGQPVCDPDRTRQTQSGRLGFSIHP